MTRKPYLLAALALLTTPLACGPATPEPADPATDGISAPGTAAPTPSPTGNGAPGTADTAAPKEPTPEEKKKAEDDKKKAEAARELAEDRAKWEAEAKTEDARWTPELRAAAKKLAEAKYKTLDEAINAALKGTHRPPKNVERDKYRHPLETLKHFGIKPNMTVLEYGPGEGWYTELLAPLLATQGKLYVTTTDPNGPADQRSTFYGLRLKRFLDRSPELFGKVERITIDSKAPKFGLDGTVDVVLAFRTMHGLHRDKLLGTFLAEAHKALKPNGVLGVEQHRAKPDANPDDAAKKGYLPEAFVIKEVEAAGFKLAGKSEVNANPKDTKDYEAGVWALPPTFENKDKDRDKYAAIGESDRMTLKFVKVAPKK
jgi:predicted methyltransferase